MSKGPYVTPKQVAVFRRLRAEGLSYNQIADAFGLSRAAVGRALRGETRAGARPEGTPVRRRRARGPRPVREETPYVRDLRRRLAEREIARGKR